VHTSLPEQDRGYTTRPVDNVHRISAEPQCSSHFKFQATSPRFLGDTWRDGVVIDCRQQSRRVHWPATSAPGIRPFSCWAS